jgi:RNA recognition motif-containing protein
MALFVANFPFEIGEIELFKEFQPFGDLLDIKIIRNYAFVTYRNEKDSLEAVKNLNGIR